MDNSWKMASNQTSLNEEISFKETSLHYLLHRVNIRKREYVRCKVKIDFSFFFYYYLPIILTALLKNHICVVFVFIYI